MNTWELDIPFDGDIANDEIVCVNCGWSWKSKDGGDDMFVCHRCGTDNTNAYVSNFQGDAASGGKVDVGALVKTGAELANTLASFKSAQAIRDANKSEMEKEISLKCGKDRWRLSKNKQNAYDSCKQGVIKKFEDIANQQLALKQRELDLQEKNLKSNTGGKEGNQTRNIIIISSAVVVLGIIGFFVVKKLKK